MSQTGEILAGMEEVLKPLVQAAKGTLNIAEDVEHAMQILANAPKRWRLILTWEGYGDHPGSREGTATTRFLAIVHHNPGMTKDPAQTLHRETKTSGQSFTNLLDLVSSWMRSMRFPNRPVDHAGLAQTDSSWVQDTPGKTRAHALTFSMTIGLQPFKHHLTIPAPTE